MERKCRKWTLEEARSVAAKYTSRTEFCEKEIGCSSYARRHGFYAEITKHMPKLVSTVRAASRPARHGHRRRDWTEGQIIGDISKYPTLDAWIKANPYAHEAAKRIGMMDDVYAYAEQTGRLTSQPQA